MSSAAGAGPTKGAVKIALLGEDEASTAVLTQYFRQFGIEAFPVPADESKSLANTYHACVVPLTADAKPLLRYIRQVRHGIVVYGTCGSVREALRFSQFGINAIFRTPVP